MSENKNFNILVVIAVFLGVIVVILGKSYYDKEVEEKARQEQHDRVFTNRKIMNPRDATPDR